MKYSFLNRVIAGYLLLLEIMEISWNLKLLMEILEISCYLVDAPGKFCNQQCVFARQAIFSPRVNRITMISGRVMGVGRSSSSNAHV